MQAALRGAEPPELAEPKDIEHAVVCRESGLRARSDCPSRIDEVFLPGQKPTKVCNLSHERFLEDQQRGFGLRFSTWLKSRLTKIFAPDGGEDEEEEPEQPR